MARSAVVRALASMTGMPCGAVRSVDLDAEPEWVRRAAKGLVAIDSADAPAPAREPAARQPGPGAGTVDDVLTRVDAAADPAAAAQTALVEEQRRAEPRSTLVDELHRRIDVDGET